MLAVQQRPVLPFVDAIATFAQARMAFYGQAEMAGRVAGRIIGAGQVAGDDQVDLGAERGRAQIAAQLPGLLNADGAKRNVQPTLQPPVRVPLCLAVAYQPESGGIHVMHSLEVMNGWGVAGTTVY